MVFLLIRFIYNVCALSNAMFRRNVANQNCFSLFILKIGISNVLIFILIWLNFILVSSIKAIVLKLFVYIYALSFSSHPPW